MNEVARRAPLPALPERAIYPPPSRVLSDAAWLVSAGREPPDGARTEAARLLDTMAPLFAPAKPAQIRNWLERINLATSQPIAGKDFDVRSPLIIDALTALPAASFTVATARQASLAFKWFPGAAEINEFLAAHARRARAFERSLRMVIDAPAAPERRQEPTEEERGLVAAAMCKITGKGEIQPPARSVEEQIAALKTP